eukprot:7307861-Prymnesium_polylepis.2
MALCWARSGWRVRVGRAALPSHPTLRLPPSLVCMAFHSACMAFHSALIRSLRVTTALLMLSNHGR